MIKARIVSASVEFHPRRLATPLAMRESRIETVVEARAHVRVVASGLDGGGDERHECEATGVGAVYLSHLWAWPRQKAVEDTREPRLIELCRRLAADLPAIVGDDAAHPLELGSRLHARVGELNKAACARVRGDISDELDAELRSMPALARLVCLSPLDAALHDAAGLALGRSAFSFYDREPSGTAGARAPTAARLLRLADPIAAVRAALRPTPRLEFPACFVAGRDDDFASLIEYWVGKRGYRRVKLKLPGADCELNVRRTADLARALRDRGVEEPWISLDMNETHHSMESVREYLVRLAEFDPAAFEAVVYLEQPVPREQLSASSTGDDYNPDGDSDFDSDFDSNCDSNFDIGFDGASDRSGDVGELQFASLADTGLAPRSSPEDWRAVARLKPVVLDEGLVSIDSLRDAFSAGWSGCALKTCKGHTFTLLAAAWARRQGWPVLLQDLTNPGYAAIHAAVLAANLKTVNGLELNSPQFTPEANVDWLPRHASLLEPRDGMHRLSSPLPAGLGSRWL